MQADLVLYNIGQLVTSRELDNTKKMDNIEVIENNGYIVIEKDKIVAVGSGEVPKEYLSPATEMVDLSGKLVTPGLIDSHTHLVHGGSRENEFAMKIAGVPYLEILDKGFVQVTMNIKDYTKNPIYRIMETVKMEAKRWGVKVTGCEIIGATPFASLTDSLKYYLACDGIKDDVDAMSMEKVVELMVKYLGLTDFDVKKVLEANI